MFVYIYTSEDETAADERKLAALEKAGHPVARIEIKE